MPAAHPLERLQFNTPSLNELKEKLPLVPIDEDKGRQPKANAGGRSVGEEAMAHAESQRDAQRRAARRGDHAKSASSRRGDLGHVVKGASQLLEERTPIDTSAAGIAADLASFEEAAHTGARSIDKRIEWTPLAVGAKQNAAGGGWQSWDGRRPGSASQLRRPASAASLSQRRAPTLDPAQQPRRPQRPGSAKTQPRLTPAPKLPAEVGEDTEAAQASAAASSAAGGSVTDGHGRRVTPVDPNLATASFNHGYTYGASLQPGSCFFAALEAAARDVASRNQPPLPISMPPTLIFGLPGLKSTESSGEPLWMWSDTATGGGLRVMRGPVASTESALDFLAGAECTQLWAASRPPPGVASRDANPPPAAAPAAEDDEEGSEEADEEADEFSSPSSHPLDAAAEAAAAVLDCACAVCPPLHTALGHVACPPLHTSLGHVTAPSPPPPSVPRGRS